MEKNNSFLLDAFDLSHRKPEYLETIFAIGNGHIGIRAGNPLKVNHLYKGNPGVFVNGFFESEKIQYGEWAYGYAKEHQTICKLPNLRGIILQIGDEDSSQEEWSVNITKMQLDMARGTLHETYHIQTPKKKMFELSLTSFTSMKRSELFVCKYSVKNCNFDEMIFMRHELNQKGDILNTDDPRVASKSHDLSLQKKGAYYQLTTKNSGKRLAIRIYNDSGQLTPQEQVVTIFQISKVHDDCCSESIFMDDIATFEDLFSEQIQSYKEFWSSSDIVIKGNGDLQKGIRFNLFHLNQGAGRDGKTNFSAKGLTGEGYEGHYFWDTEMYILPFFIYTNPQIAKSLLTYRYNILENAKKRADELAQKGALFAWRTIDGQETSAYYPAGTAQVHINADIAYGFQLYENVTGDKEFIASYGREVVFETAKFWVGFGDFLTKEGKITFCINGITGPDEYSALVNNNFYTNKMAQNNLKYAVELAERYNLYEKERIEWAAAANLMYFGYDDKKQITKQDDSFLDLARWPFETTPKEKYPLLLHYHPLIIYKHQVCKQADTVLAEMLFTKDFSKEQLQRDYEFYEKVTTHDSSLSRSIFSIMASRTGQSQKAFDYFMDTALMDLTDLQNNVVDGIHAANMGGSWLSLIYGFAGLHYDKGIRMTNNLPAGINELAFQIKYLNEIIRVVLIREEIYCELPPLTKLILEQNGTTIYIKRR